MASVLVELASTTQRSIYTLNDVNSWGQIKKRSCIKAVLSAGPVSLFMQFNKKKTLKITQGIRTRDA